MEQIIQDTILGKYLKSSIFEVPPNQRKFEWDHEQAGALLEDLINSDSETVFLGNFISLTEVGSPKIANKPVKQIVDGQQRLTTIFLLLIALRNRSLHFGEEAFFLAGKIQGIIKHTDPGSKGDYNRLKPSSSIENVFNQACEESWRNHSFSKSEDEDIHHKTWASNVSKFTKAYYALWEKIESMTVHEVDALFEKIEGATIISIHLTELSDAIDLFERTNARGRPLGVGDLVRNHLFAHNNEHGFQEAWSNMELCSNNKIVQCLRYFQISNTGHISTKKLYGKIKDLIKDIGVDDYVLRLEQFSKFFGLMTNKNQNDFDDILSNELKLGLDRRLPEMRRRLSFSLQALKLMGVNQVIPLLFACLKVTDEEKEKKKKKSALENTIKLAETIESFHFVNTEICSRPANAVETMYSEFALEIATSKSIGPVFSKLRDKLLAPNMNATFEDFDREFCDLRYSVQSKDSKDLLRYIFDKLVNHDVEIDSERRNIFIARNTYKDEVQDFNIEHVYPQKPKVDESELSQTPMLHNIGNLWTLHVKENSNKQKAGNSLPGKKIEWMKSLSPEKRGLHLAVFLDQTKDFNGLWDSDYIKARAKKMSHTCFYEVFKL